MAYTNQTCRLMHWLFADIANHNTGARVGTTTHDMYAHKAKQQMKKAYLEIIGHEGKKEPLVGFGEEFNEFQIECKDNGATIEELIEYNNEYLGARLVKEFQLFLMHYGDFSVALKMMSQAAANRFVRFVFDYCIEHEIELRKEISELYAEQNNNKYIWVCIMNGICCITGEKGADLHHCISVNQVGGYDKDNGLTIPFLPLGRKYHNIVHSIGKETFENKFKVKGVLLTEEDIIKLKEKGMYKNQFKGFRIK